MATAVFFSGSVPDAISLSHQQKRPLIIFLKGSCDNSLEIENAFRSEAFSPVVARCLVLLLEDDLGNTEDIKYNNARLFRQLFPVNQLPAVFLLGVNGVALVSVEGSISAEELLTRLENGLRAYDEQTTENTSRQAATEAPVEQTPPASQNPATPPASQNPATPPASQNPATPPASQSVRTATSMDSRPVQTASTPPEQPRVVKKKKKKQEPPPPPPVYTTAILRIRLTNDDVLEQEFPADATLREVCSHVDVHRTDGGAPYVLEMMYPRQSLGENAYSRTLKQLDLVPRSTVRLMPLSSGGGQGSEVAGSSGEAGLMSMVYNGIGSAYSYISSFSFFSVPDDNTPGENQPASRETSHQGAAETIPSQQDSRTVRRRSGWGGNVHGLHDGDDSDDRNRSSNAFWNGNSTQFGGGGEGGNAHED